MIGMTKERVLACMGAPPQKASVGETEVWSYPSGGDTTNFGFPGILSYSLHRYCIVSIVMTDERVTVVNYTGRTSQGEQCAFAVRNCVH